MSQPTAYNRQYDFADFQSASPTAPLPANQLEAELNAVETTLDETLVNLALIQRDDGALGNSVVHLDALSTAVKNVMLLSAVSIEGDFAATTAYAVGDVVVDDGTPYLCFVAHTSGATIDLTKFVAITAPLEVPGNPDDDDKFLRASGGEGVWVDLTTAMITDIASDIQDVLTADTLALARTALGLTSVGDDLATTASAAAARTTLGATTIGSTIFTAADAAAVRTAIAAPGTAVANEFTADQEISSATVDATEGPLLKLDRNSASPADNDLLGAIEFRGRSDLPTERIMAKILSQVLDVSDATEDAILAFQTVIAGSLATAGHFGAGLVVGSPTGGDPGAGKINASDVQIDGVSLSGGSGIWEVIDSGEFSNDAALDVVFTATSWRAIRIMLTDVLPATDSVALFARTSSNGGASYDAGASDYLWIRSSVLDSETRVEESSSTGGTAIKLSGNSGNASGKQGDYDLTLYDPGNVGFNKVMAQGFSQSSSAYSMHMGGGLRNTPADVDAIRVFFNSGNIVSGRYIVLGLSEPS